MPAITIDGVELEVTEGQTILQALDDLGLLMNGIDIPHYCWHPKLAIDGSCRLCQVEVEGFPKLQIACNTPVQDGMVIRTQTEAASRLSSANGRRSISLPDCLTTSRLTNGRLRLSWLKLSSYSHSGLAPARPTATPISTSE